MADDRRMPVEHIWEEIRENHFYNQVFQTLGPVEDVVCQGLLELCSDSDRLRSLTFFPHLRLSSSQNTVSERNLVGVIYPRQI